MGLRFVHADDPGGPELRSCSTGRTTTPCAPAGRGERLLRNGGLPPLQDGVLRSRQSTGCQTSLARIPLDCPALNQACNASRVRAGGHGGPADKGIHPIPRLPQQGRASLPPLDGVQIDDNSLALDPFQPVLSINRRTVRLQRAPLPGWAAALIAA